MPTASIIEATDYEPESFFGNPTKRPRHRERQMSQRLSSSRDKIINKKKEKILRQGVYFYSPDLEGFTGIGHSVEDCLYQAKEGEHGDGMHCGERRRKRRGREGRG